MLGANMKKDIFKKRMLDVELFKKITPKAGRLGKAQRAQQY